MSYIIPHSNVESSKIDIYFTRSAVFVYIPRQPNIINVHEFGKIHKRLVTLPHHFHLMY